MTLIDVFHLDMLPEERLTWQYLQAVWPHNGWQRNLNR